MNSLVTIFILFAVASCCLTWQSLKLSIKLKEQRERDKHLVEMLLKVSRFAEALTDKVTRQ
jgi:signal transduction histidine kinase